LSQRKLQAIIDGPTTGVPRQAFNYKHMILTKYTLNGLPRAAGHATVRKYFEKEIISEKWESSAWAKKRAALATRGTMNDFERFSVMLAKKQRRDRVRRTLKKEADKAKTGRDD
jgi:large subunit ribosomal protein L14e